MLSTRDHRRDILGFTYVYPVVSRRSGGVSVGVNLNPNNACNFRCIYCQVPNLVRGRGPTIDLDRLRSELDTVLEDIVVGDFLENQVPLGARRLNDIALSGNGEPTSSPQFEASIEVIEAVRAARAPDVKVVLITNGSLTHHPQVQRGLEVLSRIRGEVWFKLDRASSEGIALINGISISAADQLNRLRQTALLCPTWVHTAVFELDDAPPSPAEVEKYLSALDQLKQEKLPLQGVALYGLARPSMQAEASRLSAVDLDLLNGFAEKIRALGYRVEVSP